VDTRDHSLAELLDYTRESNCPWILGSDPEYTSEDEIDSMRGINGEDRMTTRSKVKRGALV
jgi:hypothetical protein